MREERTSNFYAVLEVPSNATRADIKKAWIEQLQVWHPDRFSHSPELSRKAEARTKLINQAYQTLSVPAARARYDAATRAPAASARPSSPQATPPPRPQPAARARQGPRGPQAAVTLSREGHPIIMVPACHILVDSRQHLPYTFEGFSRIAGTISQALPAGDYAIAEAPDVFCLVRKRVEEFMSEFSNPYDNRPRFMAQLEPLLAYPYRFLLIEGTLQHLKSGGVLGQYQKNGLMDFLDALTAKYGIHIIYSDSREEAEARVANLAAMHYAYYFAEEKGLGRCLKEDDL